MLVPRVEYLSSKILIGKSITMSFAANTTHELWHGFMSSRAEVPHVVGHELYSLQQYGVDFFRSFNPNTVFRKWAAVEVSAVSEIPEGMEHVTLEGGMYAVFDYKGDTKNAANTFQYIFGVWLPQSPYELDDRLHFEVLGEKYKNGDPNSEEEIWIPIREKN